MEEAPYDAAPQWTVGQLRAELVGLPDDMPVVVYVHDRPGGDVAVRQVLVGAGFGAGVDAGEALFVDGEFALSAEYQQDTYNP